MPNYIYHLTAIGDNEYQDWYGTVGAESILDALRAVIADEDLAVVQQEPRLSLTIHIKHQEGEDA